MMDSLWPRRFCTRQVARLVVAMLALLAWVGVASGQALEPFESPQISQTQWRVYYFEVESAHRDSMQLKDAELLVQFRDTDTATIWTFTQVGHPAHPGWVTRRVVTAGGQSNIRQVGYFAGDEAAFVTLFQSFLAQNQKLQERMAE